MTINNDKTGRTRRLATVIAVTPGVVGRPWSLGDLTAFRLPKSRPHVTYDEISIVYVTYRPDAAFAWFADSLARQIGDDDVEVVVVDGLADSSRAALFTDLAADRFKLRHVAAKPTVFNGPHQRTPTALHAAASARNTGFIVSSAAYLVFVDDCAVLMPGWWREVRLAARYGYVVTGARHKAFDVRVRHGELVSFRPHEPGVDSRWGLGDDLRMVRVPGVNLYTSSLGIPRSVLNGVGGFDEICDGVGGEDYHLGIRLEFAGVPTFFSRALLTVESEELHTGSGQKRFHDPEMAPDRYMARLAELGVTQRSTGGRFDASHMALDLLYGTKDPVSLGNHFDVTRVLPNELEATAATLPQRFWFNGQPWSELVETADESAE